MSILNPAAQGACVPSTYTKYLQVLFLLVEQTAGLVGATAKSESWWRVDGLDESSMWCGHCPAINLGRHVNLVIDY